MVVEPDTTAQPAPQDNQSMSKRRVLSFKPQLRLEWRGQDGQNETEQPNHSDSLGDSISSSTRIRFSVHTVRPGNVAFEVSVAHVACGQGVSRRGRSGDPRSRRSLRPCQAGEGSLVPALKDGAR